MVYTVGRKCPLILIMLIFWIWRSFTVGNMMYNGQNISPMVGENILQHVITYTANNYNAKNVYKYFVCFIYTLYFHARFPMT